MIDLKTVKSFKKDVGFTSIRIGKVTKTNTARGLVITHMGKRDVNSDIKIAGLPTIKELKKKYKVVYEAGTPDNSYGIIFDLDKPLTEVSTSGDVPGYMTPKAFSKDTKSTSNGGTEETERFGYKKAKETHVNFKELWENTNKLYEITYREYKKAPGMSSKQKLNIAIKECNRALYEIQQYLRQNKKLREEEGLGLGEYWKSTAIKLVKMNERLKALQKEIKQFGLKDILAQVKEEATGNKKVEPAGDDIIGQVQDDNHVVEFTKKK